MQVGIAQVRCARILALTTVAIFMATCRRASHMIPHQVSQLRTNAASQSEQTACMHPVTIISAYYPLNVSKHSSKQYDEWMANFLPYVSAPIVLYSPPGGALDQIRELRGDLPMTIKVGQMSCEMHVADSDLYSAAIPFPKIARW